MEKTRKMTTLRMQPNLTEEMKINHFHAHLRGLALKTKNLQKHPENTHDNTGRYPESLSPKVRQIRINCFGKT